MLNREIVLGAKLKWPQKRGGCPSEVVVNRGSTVCDLISARVSGEHIGRS